MKNLELKGLLLWHRDKTLVLTKLCLEGYARTQKQFYYDNAKFFGKQSAELKREFDSLLR